jgi:probable HAF family extracellular repeat protein
LGTLIAGCRSSIGYGINTSGQVVGSSVFGNLFNPSQHAFLATPGSAMQDLGGLGGPGLFGGPGPFATAIAINDSGQIVGASTYIHPATVPDFAQHAFLTTATASSMTDLGTLGGFCSSAYSINSRRYTDPFHRRTAVREREQQLRNGLSQ